jgi:hypothetical protein
MSYMLYGERGTNPTGVTLLSSGQVIPGVPGKRHRVFAVFVSALLATNVRFQSGVTDISGTFACSSTGGFILPYVKLAWFVTQPGQALNLSMSVNTQVGIQVIYDTVE